MFTPIKQKCIHTQNNNTKNKGRENSSKHRGGLHYMWSVCGACFSHTVLAVTLVGFVKFITKSYLLIWTMTAQYFFWEAFKVAIPSSPASSPLHSMGVPGLGGLYQGMLGGGGGWVGTACLNFMPLCILQGWSRWDEDSESPWIVTWERRWTWEKDQS